MRKYLINICLLGLTNVSLSSCEAIGGIFKAGVWSGVLLIVLAIGVIIYIATRVTKRK
jgi:hypothetical protein